VPAALIAHGGAGGTGNFTLNTVGASLLVGVNSTNATSAPVDNTYGLTWTQVPSCQASGGGFGGTSSLWYINNPASTNAAHSFKGSGSLCGCAILSFSGTDTSTPVDNHAEAASNQAGSRTPSNAGSLIVCATGGPWTGVLTVTDSQLLQEQFVGAGGVTYGVAISYVIQGAATATNPAWMDNNGVGPAADIGIALMGIFNPSTGGGGGGKPFTYYQRMQLAHYRREQQARERLIARAAHETILRKAA
jgi:hypothetical protein